MSGLVLFTNNFPFGDGEAFLETEIVFLSKAFSNVHIFPLFYGKNTNPRALPPNVTSAKPFIDFDFATDKLKLLLSGIFNTAPVSFALHELFAKTPYKKASHFQNFLSTTLVNRILLKKSNFEPIISKLSKNTIAYFYWGDKASGIVPFLAKRNSTPIVARFHNSDLYEEIKDDYIPFRSELLTNLTSAVFISKMGEIYLANRYSQLKFNTKLSRLGVKDLVDAKPSTDNVLRIVSCSYVVPIKRLHLIIEALNLLNFEIKWTHLGGGKYLNKLKKLSNDLKPNIKPVFYGQINNTEVINFYEKNPVDLFVNVSESEGIPVSIMEAISAGIPIIATDVGGTSEIVNEEFGVLIPKNFSVEYLTEKIKKYHETGIKERTDMRKKAKLFWSKYYNADVNYNTFAKFLQNTLNKANR